MQEAEHKTSASEADVIRIYGGIPVEDGKKRAYITKLDTSLGSLKECEYVHGP